MAKVILTLPDGDTKIHTDTERDVHFYSVRMEPFRIYGLYNPQDGKPFRRLPEEVAKATSESVQKLNYNTAGGRVRFATDSEYIYVKTKTPYTYQLAFMSRVMLNGFDVFADGAYAGSIKPPVDFKDGFEEVLEFKTKKMRCIEINFPLYGCLDELYIGLRPGAALKAGKEYSDKRRIVYYGSSITQGAFACRPGNAYESIIARRLDCDYLNLGFSGSARAEDAMVYYIAGLDMDLFVCDYDHNAPDVEHLQNTHEKLYRAVRERHPGMPILFVTKPDFDWDPTGNAYRREVVYNTYIKALREGDTHVAFVDGQSLFHGADRECCTTDGCHPNDAGFVRMADVIGEQIRRLLYGGNV